MAHRPRAFILLPITFSSSVHNILRILLSLCFALSTSGSSRLPWTIFLILTLARRLLQPEITLALVVRDLDHLNGHVETGLFRGPANKDPRLH